MKNAIKRRIDLIVWFALMLFVWVMFFLSGGLAHAAVEPQVYKPPTLSVCWDAPTKRLDGTPLSPTEIDRYEVEYRSSDGTQSIVVPSPNTGFDQEIGYGEHCYRVRVFDTSGLDSPWTPEVCKTVIAAPATITFKQCEG